MRPSCHGYRFPASTGAAVSPARHPGTLRAPRGAGSNQHVLLISTFLRPSSRFSQRGLSQASVPPSELKVLAEPGDSIRNPCGRRSWSLGVSGSPGSSRPPDQWHAGGRRGSAQPPRRIETPWSTRRSRESACISSQAQLCPQPVPYRCKILAAGCLASRTGGLLRPSAVRTKSDLTLSATDPGDPSPSSHHGGSPETACVRLGSGREPGVFRDAGSTTDSLQWQVLRPVRRHGSRWLRVMFRPGVNQEESTVRVVGGWLSVLPHVQAWAGRVKEAVDAENLAS